ncbi:meiotic recombination protein SPO11-1 isoform X3 [Spinacia oleracea]|uniref:Meiotic recombination protein SPO11-1 isoform X3 n=1 Tax=Spinacia oleracea TaxID=3562 RepID=A0ABM3RUS4_SPIOL|nr:meiotic recombination protein SPO11-1 isoform X3 [Spinacia oleracea]
MEGKRSTPTPSDLIQKIREFSRSILVDLCNGRSPVIFINKFRTYCKNSAENCFCSSNVPVGAKVLTLRKQPHAHRIDQSVVDRAINDICIVLKCSRHNLNVVSVAKGLVMGWVRYSEGGKKFDCISSPNTAQPVPVQVEDVQDILSFAEYILVVEKESVFQRLANDKFCSLNRCIVITGRGYPDVPTRRFLRLLAEKLHIPVYCLVDSDPYGFDILATYRFGSLEMAYDVEFLCVPNICWLGAFTSDYEKFALPSQCLLPLTTEDKNKIEALLQRCYLQHEEPHWRLELQRMQEKGVKFEIEALSVNSLSFLTKEYLPSKIQCTGGHTIFLQISTKFEGLSHCLIDY